MPRRKAIPKTADTPKNRSEKLHRMQDGGRRSRVKCYRGHLSSFYERLDETFSIRHEILAFKLKPPFL